MTLKLCSQLVERRGTGAPSAFRIWPAGRVETDIGVFNFSERSATLIMADQAERGVRFPFDLDHLSMQVSAPEPARRAVGWHGLEVRNGELWATECEWTPDVRKGLEQNPPTWRYYSPVFLADAETTEITKYLGCALTNSPATHQPTDLAIAASRLVQSASTAPASSSMSNQHDSIRVALARNYGEAFAAATIAKVLTGRLPLSQAEALSTMDPKMARALKLAPPPEPSGVAIGYFPSVMAQ